MHTNIQDITDSLSLSEKIDMIHGAALFKNGDVPGHDIPALVMSDGPCGVRFNFEDNAWIKKDEELSYSSWLPSGAAIAATWNPAAAHASGYVLGEEARGRGKDIILAPGINIHRTPLCGRNFEYMSEDPFLTGILAAAEIIGIQENDVAACVKHFALNNQEKDRMSVDVVIDDRALYEIYLPAFRAATQLADSYTIMCSYNKIRGCFASESKLLMTDILRDEWNYEGVIISDWGAVHSTTGSALNGVDIEMGVSTDFDDYFYADRLEAEVEAGNVPMTVIDERIKRILKLENTLKIGEPDRKTGCYNTPSHHEALLNTARESIVLLKNDGNILPLGRDKPKRIAVIGDAATRRIAHGGGSSEVNALFEITPYLGINMVSGANVTLSCCPGYLVDNADNTNGEVNWQASSLDCIPDSAGPDTDTDKLTSEAKRLLDEAVSLARECDEVIYIGGLNRAYDTEGFDRTSYELPYNQDTVINALLDVNPDTIIYIQSGSAVNMSSFAHRAKCILWSSMNGMHGGTALGEVIFGLCNPSGRLPVTFAADINDYPSHSVGEYPGTPDDNGSRSCRYSEGIYVGYRHFMKNNIKPVFEFGHGLSYTDFSYSNLIITKEPVTHCEGDVCSVEYDNFIIECTITNTGDMDGSEVVMMFIADGNNITDRPPLELKGFKKVHVKAGEAVTVRLQAGPSSFAYYDESAHGFRAIKGNYSIKLGHSVSDIRLEDNVTLSMNHNIDSIIRCDGSTDLINCM